MNRTVGAETPCMRIEWDGEKVPVEAGVYSAGEGLIGCGVWFEAEPAVMRELIAVLRETCTEMAAYLDKHTAARL